MYEGYNFDREALRDINFQMVRENIRKRELKKHLSETLGVLDEELARKFVGNFLTGYMLGRPFPEDNHLTEYLHALSHTLYSLGFDETSPLVARVRQNHANFDYPPKDGKTIREIRTLKVLTTPVPLNFPIQTFFPFSSTTTA